MQSNTFQGYPSSTFQFQIIILMNLETNLNNSYQNPKLRPITSQKSRNDKTKKNAFEASISFVFSASKRTRKTQARTPSETHEQIDYKGNQSELLTCGGNDRRAGMKVGSDRAVEILPSFRCGRDKFETVVGRKHRPLIL